VRVNPHYAPLGKTDGGGALSKASRLGKLAQAGRTSTGVIEADVARLAAYHCSKERRGA
jgi:hypothetical protein